MLKFIGFSIPAALVAGAFALTPVTANAQPGASVQLVKHDGKYRGHNARRGHERDYDRDRRRSHRHGSSDRHRDVRRDDDRRREYHDDDDARVGVGVGPFGFSIGVN